MDSETPGIDLLDMAQQALETEVAARLDGDARAMVLMIGRAMRMAAREYAQEERAGAAQAALMGFVDHADNVDKLRALCRNIRDGRHDADPQVHAALWAEAVIRTSVSKPSALARTERRLAGLGENPMSDDSR